MHTEAKASPFRYYNFAVGIRAQPIAGNSQSEILVQKKLNDIHIVVSNCQARLARQMSENKHR